MIIYVPVDCLVFWETSMRESNIDAFVGCPPLRENFARMAGWVGIPPAGGSKIRCGGALQIVHTAAADPGGWKDEILQVNGGISEKELIDCPRLF